MERVTVIPERLAYGRVGSALAGEVPFCLDDVAAPEFRKGRYEVCHYRSRDLGGCVGPLAIDQTLLFGRELDARLKDPGASVTVEYGPEERENVAVVVGVYLVLGQGWSAEQVCRALPEDARLTQPCSWIRPQDLRTKRGSPRMRVQDCWEGAQMARDLGWLHKDSVVDSMVASLTATKFWQTTQEYDGSWLVPGGIFVMADPITTISDPDPKTCSTFCSSIGGGSTREKEETSLDDLQRPSWSESLPSSPDPKLRGTFSREVSGGSRSPELEGASGRQRKSSILELELEEAEPEEAERLRAGGSPQADDGRSARPTPSGSARPTTPGSCASVCTVIKPYDSGPTCSTSWTRHELGRPEAKPFVDFLREEGIVGVVRVNLPDEPGLAELGGSYDPGLLTGAGIGHADVPVSDRADRRGAVPQASTVRRFLSVAGEVAPEGDGALLVHCKGGFGRSVFLACLLVIHRHDVPGRGLLGWARIARPGAITTPEQEDALRSLAGRADLCRRYGVAPPGRRGGAPGARACCAVS